MKQVYVASVDLEQRTVLTSEGKTCEVDCMIDLDGDFTQDPDLAEVVIFQAAEACWCTLKLDEFQPVLVH